MIDPLSALSVATAVCQFLEFGGSLLSSTWKIYHGHDDATASFAKEAENFKAATNTLKTVQKNEEARERRVLEARRRQILQLQPSGGIEEFGEADKKLLDFLQECEKLANTVLALLSRFAVKGDPSALQSFKLAMKMKLRKEELQRCGKQLEKQRAELATHLLTVLWTKSGSVMTTLRNFQERDDAMQVTLSSKLDSLKEEILQLSAAVTGGTSQLTSRLTDFKTETERVSKTQYFLSAFRYDAMRVREVAVSRRHANTFKWIFETSQENDSLHSGFLDWLQSESGVFWVSGKAGSGKSTLMKYIFENESTIKNLQLWAKNGKLVSSRHFFWRAGTPLQKSQTGLLRSLCYDIFRHCPDLLPTVLDQRWAMLPSLASLNFDPTAVHVWSHADLLDIIEKACASGFTSNGQDVYFSFFIDGLDEYDGSPDDLIDTLRSLCRFRNIKLCISSRPWNAFSFAFGKDPSRMLVLQDLTRDDIVLYVRDKLEADERFVRLKMRDERSMAIVEEITTKAQGVFLWVFLVIKELMKSLTNDDSFSILQRRLRLVPPDLETYFRHMFDHLDSFYQVETAQIFRVMLEAPQYVPLLSFAVLEGDDPLAVRLVSDPSTGLPDLERVELCKRLQSHIQGRVCDLLEVRDGIVVDFLHRTVRDFLLTKEINELLDSRTGPDFDIDEVACKMSLVSLRYLHECRWGYSEDSETFGWILPVFFDHARSIEDKQHRAPITLVRTMQALLDQTSHSFANALPRDMKLMAEMSLPLSLEEELGQSRVSRAYATDLMYSAMCYLGHQPRPSNPPHPSQRGAQRPFWEMSWEFDPERRGFRPEIVALLLRSGADAQRALAKFLSTLPSMDRNARDATRPAALSLCKQLIEGGASLDDVSINLEKVTSVLGASNVQWLLDLQQPRGVNFKGILSRWVLRKG